MNKQIVSFGAFVIAAVVSAIVPADAQGDESKSLIVTPPTLGRRANLYVMPTRNLIIGGDCSAEHLFRFDNLRQIEKRLDAGCGAFLVGDQSGVIIKTFTDGLALYSLEDGKRASQIEGALSYGHISAGVLVSNESSLITAYDYKPDVYRVDLRKKKSWKRIGAHRAGLSVDAIAASSSGSAGISVARYPSKQTEVILWDFSADRKIASYNAETATISEDGRLFALAIKTADEKYRLEMRRFPDGQIISQLAIGELSYKDYGKHDLRHGSFVFLADGKSLAFLTETDGPDGNLAFRVWEQGSSSADVRFKLDASYLDDIISIRSDVENVYILKANGVHRFSIKNGQPASENPIIDTFDPLAAAVSSDSALLALSENRKIVIVDTSTGGVINSYDIPAPKSDYCGNDCKIKNIAFVPGERRLVFSDENGSVASLDVATGSMRSLFTTSGDKDKGTYGFAVSASGRYLAFVQRQNALILDIASNSVIARFPVPKSVGELDLKLAFVDDDRRLLVAGWSTLAFDLAQKSRILDYKTKMYIDGTKYYNAFARHLTPTAFLGDSWIVGVSGAPGGQLLAYRDGQIVEHFGLGRPGTGFLAGQADAALGYSETQMIVGRGNDVRLTDPSFNSWVPVASHASAVMLLAKLKSGNLLSVSKDSEVRIGLGYSSTDLVRTTLYSDGNWIAVSPEGFFSGTDQAMQKLYIRSGTSDVVPLESLYQALYRPDLVREKLAGDPKGLVRDAAAKLDLNKVIASGAAPRVSIVTPARGGSVADDEVAVEASIAEQNGGGIGRIEWRVNGVTLGIETRGLERLPEGTSSSPATSRPAVTVKRTLALEPGENKIEVVAYNGRDLIASDPAQITLKWDGEKSATPPKLHVLAVGVNDYWDSRLKLSYAVPDAKALGDALRKAGSSMYQSVEVTSVLDDKVTIDNLDKVFAEVSGKVHPRDVFVFFLAGHGKTVDGRYHFLPQNFRYESEDSIVKRGIDQDRFQAWFAKIPARKSILLYDTCESGSLTGDRVQQRGIERVAALEKMTRAMGRTVLSASSDDAPALEGYRGHGVFTYALLDALDHADVNKNGLIEVSELSDHIDSKVPDFSFEAFKLRQIPQRRIVGNNFPVVSRTAVLAATGAPEAKASAPISTKSTHVVVSQSPVDVYAAAARGGAVVQRLQPGTLVTLIEGVNGWQLVFKEGKRLGYVDQSALAAIQ